MARGCCTLNFRPIFSLAVIVALGSSIPVIAQDGDGPAPAAATGSNFDMFVPRPSGRETNVDYSFWDDALSYMVLRMGPSTRQGERRPDARLGTRQVYGHDSRVRLEGNRVAFSLLSEEAITPLAEYREDLERIGSEIDIATLPRNEQLAFWLNLHNVAVIEMIARNYPVKSPSQLKLGENQSPLDTTPFINVGGVALSPNDIRTKIVFPNWSDAIAIYGFFRGEVGGPSIQRTAFNGNNVNILLEGAADEFVNSLRGVEGYGSNLLVSKIYEEAAPFYFPQMGDDLKVHLTRFAGEDVSALVADKAVIKTNNYVATTADLAGGEREPIYNTVSSDGIAQSTRITPSVARFLGERFEKYEKLRKEGLLRGRVIVLPPTGVEEEPKPETPEVE